MDIQSLIDDYAAWLKSEISFDKVGEYYEITTPYLNNANDYLQIYVRQNGDDVFFSDDASTINSLKMNGVSFSAARRAQLTRILNQFGVQLQKDELVAKAPIQLFAQKKHFFVQAMLRIDDLFSMPRVKGTPFFLEDIQTFFSQKDIFYSDNILLSGISGFSHNYDFLLQRSKHKPERLCQAVNSATKENMTNLLFSWNDTKPSRRSDTQLIVLINDENTVGRGVIDGFESYNAKVIRWSQRNDAANLDLLSAS